MQKQKLLYTGSVVGVTFEPFKSNLQFLIKFFQNKNKHNKFNPKVKLKHIPDNPYDKNTIQVLVGQDGFFFKIGWIPKTHLERIHQIGIENTELQMRGLSEYYNDKLECLEIVGVAINVFERVR